MPKEPSSDSDTFSESDYDSENTSAIDPDKEEADLFEEVEPELSAPSYSTEYKCYWTQEAQLKAQIEHACLVQTVCQHQG
jgi:hypothetical protein